MTARWIDITGPAPIEVLTKTTGSILINRSPRHARRHKLREDREDEHDEQRQKRLDMGTIIHELMLGKGRGFAVAEYTEPTADEQLAAMVANYEETGELPPPPKKKGRAKKPPKAPDPPPIAKESGRPEWQNWMRADAKAAKAAIRARGLIPLLPKEKRIAEAGARVLKAECERLGYPFDGESEAGIEWTERARDGTEITCWGQLDHVRRDGGRIVIYDLKILDSAHPRSVQRHLVNMGGDIQQAAYTRAVEQACPQYAGRVDFVFLCCELYTGIVTPCPPAASLKRLGELKWTRAVNTWAWCLARDEWPAYATGPVHIEAPEYALLDEMTAQHDNERDLTTPASAGGSDDDEQQWDDDEDVF